MRKTKLHARSRHYSLGLGDGDRTGLQPRPTSTFCSDDARGRPRPHFIGRLSRLWCPSRIDWPLKMSVNRKPAALARGKARAWLVDLDQRCVSLQRHVLPRSSSWCRTRLGLAHSPKHPVTFGPRNKNGEAFLNVK